MLQICYREWLSLPILKYTPMKNFESEDLLWIGRILAWIGNTLLAAVVFVLVLGLKEKHIDKVIPIGVAVALVVNGVLLHAGNVLFKYLHSRCEATVNNDVAVSSVGGDKTKDKKCTLFTVGSKVRITPSGVITTVHAKDKNGCVVDSPDGRIYVSWQHLEPVND